MRKIRIIVVLVLFIVILAFSMENSAIVQLSFWFWDIESSMALMIFSCLAIGILLGGVFGIPHHFRMRRKILDLQKENKRIIDELKDSKPVLHIDKNENDESDDPH